MRRQITYIPEYQLIAILFNANVNIISLASSVNKHAHVDLAYTGDLGSYDATLSTEFKFVTFSDDNKISKTTIFLLHNKTQANIQNPVQDLFSNEELLTQRYLIGNKSSIYNHKNLISSDYCFIVSYPLGQPKPTDLLNKLKKMSIINTAIEINFDDFHMFGNLSEEIELYIDEYNYNLKCKQTDLSKNRRKILSERSKATGDKVETTERMVFPNL